MSYVSCIIPFYMGGDTIIRAIDSVINGHLCLEVIVVSDASPEALDPILTESHQEQIVIGKLRIINLASNHGQASARNMGASVSRGSYLSFLDQDDMYLPGFYDTAVNYLEENRHVAALEVGAEYVQDGIVVLDKPDPRYDMAILSVPWNVVIRRNLFWACGAFPVGEAFRTKAAGEDIAFKNALRQFFPVAVSQNKYIRHHIRDGSATDRFLKRTKVVDGKVIFNTIFSNESDGSLAQALDQHVKQSFKFLTAQNAVNLKTASATIYSSENINQTEEVQLPIRVVCATRLKQDQFLTKSLTGITIKAFHTASNVELRIFAENSIGLGELYNIVIEESKSHPAILVFMHDDVAICDFFWTNTIRQQLKQFDILGLAGNKRRLDKQPSWSIASVNREMDSAENLSGAIGQGICFPPERFDVFGSVGVECKLLDGLFLAVDSRVFHSSGLRFDPQFQFHFYDMDFCRQAEFLGLKMGTVPISVIHASYGNWSSEWHDSYKRYLNKWKK